MFKHTSPDNPPAPGVGKGRGPGGGGEGDVVQKFWSTLFGVYYRPGLGGERRRRRERKREGERRRKGGGSNRVEIQSATLNRNTNPMRKQVNR